jgi:hypothetical protein
MTALIEALDVSHYSGPITPSQWRRLYREGLRHVTVQLWGGRSNGTIGPNTLAADQLAGARDVDMTVGGYYWLPPDDEIQTALLISSARQAAGTHWPNLEFVAADIEALFPLKPLHPINPYARLRDALDNVHRHHGRNAIYTNAYMWAVLMLNDTRFSHLPLWWPRYDGKRHPLAGWQPFAGWQRPAMKQWANTRLIAGVSAAPDTATPAILRAQPPPDPDPNPFPEGFMKLVKNLLPILHTFAANQEEKDNPELEAAHKLAWQHFYDAELSWRRPWMDRG